jgi:hypothetical protein
VRGTSADIQAQALGDHGVRKTAIQLIRTAGRLVRASLQLVS